MLRPSAGVYLGTERRLVSGTYVGRCTFHLKVNFFLTVFVLAAHVIVLKATN